LDPKERREAPEKHRSTDFEQKERKAQIERIT
jgi:hypothetical protein